MGPACTEIELSNPRDDSLKPVTARALVDTADGREHSIPYVGPIRVRFDNRSSFSGALVLGDTVLMGAIQMEDMDLVVHPRTQTVTVNPANPNTPLVIVK